MTRPALGGCTRVGLALVLALVIALAVLALFRDDGQSSGNGSPESRPTSRGDVLSERTFNAAVAAALRAPALSTGWSRGNLHVLAKSVAGQGIWRLAYLETPRQLCLVLLVPRVTKEGSCGTHAQFGGRTLVYTGETPSGKDPSRPSNIVVYGLVPSAVTSLHLQLSDCSESSVSLRGRPLFWVLIPRDKLADGVVPIRYSVTGRNRRTFSQKMVRPNLYPARCGT
jgi:hypothetical protein